MTKIFLQGDDSINDEIHSLLKDKAEFVQELNNSAELVIDSTNFPAETKMENIKLFDEKCTASIPVLTSSLCTSVSEQSSWSKYPSRLIGIGLYKTFSKAKLIEIAPSKITDGKLLKNAESFLTSAGINFIKVPDRTGLVFPRILAMIINEAAQVYSEKIATKEDIDTAMKLGTNYPYGPLEWADKIGVDLVYNILASLHKDFGEDRYRPHPILKEMVDLKMKFYEA